MILKITLEQEDFDNMHDVIADVIDSKPSDEEIQLIWDGLPDNVKSLAIQWGTSDTVFRDKLYLHLENDYKANK